MKIITAPYTVETVAIDPVSEELMKKQREEEQGMYDSNEVRRLNINFINSDSQFVKYIKIKFAETNELKNKVNINKVELNSHECN